MGSAITTPNTVGASADNTTTTAVDALNADTVITLAETPVMVNKTMGSAITTPNAFGASADNTTTTAVDASNTDTTTNAVAASTDTAKLTAAQAMFSLGTTTQPTDMANMNPWNIIKLRENMPPGAWFIDEPKRDANHYIHPSITAQAIQHCNNIFKGDFRAGDNDGGLAPAEVQQAAGSHDEVKQAKGAHDEEQQAKGAQDQVPPDQEEATPPDQVQQGEGAHYEVYGEYAEEQQAKGAQDQVPPDQEEATPPDQVQQGEGAHYEVYGEYAEEQQAKGAQDQVPPDQEEATPPDQVQQGKGANYEVYGKYTMMKDKNYFWFGAMPFRSKSLAKYDAKQYLGKDFVSPRITSHLRLHICPNPACQSTFRSLAAFTSHHQVYCSIGKCLPAHRMPQVFYTQGTVGILLHEAVENMIKCFARDPQYEDEPPLDFINPMARTLPDIRSAWFEVPFGRNTAQSILQEEINKEKSMTSLWKRGHVSKSDISFRETLREI